MIRSTLLIATLCVAGCGGDDSGLADASIADASVDGGSDAADAAVASGIVIDRDAYDPRCHAAIDSIVELANEYTITGGAFAVVLDEEIACQVPYGLERRASLDRPVTADSWFRWPQMTGLLLRIAALELAAAGELDLDAAVSDLVGDLGLQPVVWADAIRVRDLVSGRSGIPDFGSSRLSRGILPNCTEAGPTAAEWWSTFDSGQRVMWAEPGLIHALGRSEMVLLSRVLETVTSQTLPEVFDRTIFQPASMTRSSLGFGPEHYDAEVFGHPVDAGSGGLVILDAPLLSCPAAWGNLGTITTLADAARLMGALARDGLAADGSRVFAQDTMTALSSSMEGSFWNDEAGPGGFVYRHDGTPLVFGNGAYAGFASGYVFAPSAGFAVIELANHDDWHMQNPASVAAVQEHLGASVPNLTYAPAQPWTPSPSELMEFAGTYVAPVRCDDELVLTVDGTGLLGGGIRGMPRSPDRFDGNAGMAQFWRRDGAIHVLVIPIFDEVFYPQGQVPPELEGLTGLQPCP